MSFKGRVAVVTGGGQGIGKATCLAFHQRGASIVVVDRDASTGGGTAATILREGGEAVFALADVSSEKDVLRLAELTISRHGGIDILVNNAAIAHEGTVEGDSTVEWDAVIANNLRSVFLCSHYLIPQMKQRGGGVIVNVASVQSLAASPRSAAYVASKFGVLGLTKAMAIDHAPEIRVNAVLPGSVDTPLFRSGHPAGTDVDSWLSGVAGRYPLRRIGQPDEIAEVILFLADTRSSFVTGACILADGGLGARI